MIPIATKGEAEEELISLKAVTYNLENGKVVETKLEPKVSVFKENYDKELSFKKFTFPNIKEGSIIEYQYTLRSDFIFNLQPWTFQGSYPRLWSEYTVSLPEFYYYVTLTQGYHPYHIRDQKSKPRNFAVVDNDRVSSATSSIISAMVTDFRWVMKDVPSLKEESYTSTLGNHIARIQFQLAELRHPFVPTNVMSSWPKACEELLKREEFGYSLDRDNPWLNDAMSIAINGATDPLKKAKNIYTFVRDNITCTGQGGKYLEQTLRNVLRNRNGHEAEINLLLVTMLRKADLDASPVILSTRSHGYAYAMYPLMDRFNYVIAQVTINGQQYYLDASEPRLGFGKLNYECYNGHARVINEEATPIELISDSLLEKSMTSVFITANDKGNMEGTIQQAPGYYQSLRIRNKWKDKGKDELLADIKKSFNEDVEVSELSIDSLEKYDEPVALKYSFELRRDTDDIMYINPMFSEGYRENPFKSTKRSYPVEMPYTIDETYLLQLTVPEGYVTDELPRQLVVKLNEADDGMFEYRLSESNGTISLRSRLRLKRSYFQPDEYETLREFFNMVVKKHNEQIVFKKKK